MFIEGVKEMFEEARSVYSDEGGQIEPPKKHKREALLHLNELHHLPADIWRVYCKRRFAEAVSISVSRASGRPVGPIDSLIMESQMTEGKKVVNPAAYLIYGLLGAPVTVPRFFWRIWNSEEY